MRRIVLCALLHIGLNAAVAKPINQVLEHGPIRLELEADQDTPGFGELVQLSLSVTAETKILPTFPDIPDELGNILVLERSAIGPFTLDEQRQLWQRTYTLLPQSLGEQTIPALTVHWQALPEGCPPQCPAAQSDSFQAFAITVTSVLEEGVELNQLQATSAPLSLSPAVTEDRSAWSWLVLGGGLLASGALWLALRKRVSPAAIALSSDPLQEALAALDELQAEGLLSVEHGRRFYLRLSNILRQYLSATQAIPALQRTRQEIYASLSPSDQAEQIEQILAQCDAVMFARFAPSVDSMQKIFTQTRAYLTASGDGTG